MCFGPSTLGAGAKTRLESRIKTFTPHCVCRYADTLDLIGARFSVPADELLDINKDRFPGQSFTFNLIIRLTWIMPRTVCMVLNVLT